jgi:ABC-type transport system involved in multi-copper enzyme maturation permease subunit
MVWVIARKEIHENLISLRFLLLFLLAIVFIPSSLYTNYRGYLRRLGEQQQIEQRNRDYVRKLQPAQIFTAANLTFDIYWPPAPASVFASGFEEEHPRHLLVGKYSVEYGAPLDVKPPAGLFGAIDCLFVVQLIFSLFAVLLAFDAITREKESGTLRSILSNRLSRATLATGKLIGGYLTLALPLAVAFLAGLAVLAAAGMNVFAGDFAARAAWILAGSLLYLAVFFVLGLLVSSLASTTYAALVVSLAFWLVAVLVAPRGASLVSQLLRPVTSRQAAWLEKQAALQSIERDKGRALEELLGRVGVLNEEGRRVPGKDWQQHRTPVAAAFDERAAGDLRGIEESYQRRKAEQRGLGLALARLSPAGALVNFSTEMAVTGSSMESRFLADAERYREVLGREVFSRIYRDSYPGGGVTMGMLGPIRPSALPEFRMTRPAVAESFFGTDLAILLGWFLAGTLAVYRAVGKYDVR